MKSFSITAPIVWAFIVVLLHIMPVQIETESDFRIPNADKIVHFTMFAVMAFLLLRSVKFHHTEITRLQTILILCSCICFGGCMELLQGIPTTQRDSDLFDWYADIAGSIGGLLVANTNYLSFFFRHQIRETA